MWIMGQKNAKRKAISQNIMKIHARHGTHSMIISKKGIIKLLDYFTHVYLWGPIDNDMHYIHDLKEYSAQYVIDEPLVSILVH